MQEVTLEQSSSDKIFDFQGLIFKHDKMLDLFYLEIDGSKTIGEVYTSILNILKEMESVKRKGYVNEVNLYHWPIILEFLPELGFTVSMSTRKAAAINSIKIYKWIYNIVIINLYELTILNLKKLEFEKRECEDLYIDYLNLKKTLFQKLDTSISNKLTRRGITITQNIYVGFDTEYKAVDSNFNKLISLQMALNTRMLIRIPINTPYNLCTVDSLTNEKYLEEITIEGFSQNKLEISIGKRIDSIRAVAMADYDLSLLKLIHGLEKLGIRKIQKEEHVIFTLPLTEIQPLIAFPGSAGVSFKEMLRLSINHCEPILNETYFDLIQQLVSIFKEEEEGGALTNTIWQNRVKLENNNELVNVLPTIELLKTDDPLNGEQKRLSRTFTKSFTNEPVSVSRIRNAYFVAHLTNADLAMFTDFEELKLDLDIVNKSFVTLGKPLTIENTNVFIRDTMLLTPALSKSLESIGQLYGFEKLKLSKEEITNMDILLATDKEKFTDYACRDAIIPLIHANFMEYFNYQLGETGIPITLSSLGQHYVKHFWRQKGYKGYQLNSKYLLSDMSSVISPRGLFSLGEIGAIISMYIANYKGGRNECFMYGVDRETM